MKPDITIIAKSPNLLTDTEKQDFIAMVLAGGEVSDKVLAENVKKAECLVFLYKERCLIGVSALKNPKKSYRDKISEKTGVSIKDSDYPYELGYVFIMPSARGQKYSIILSQVAQFFARSKGIYATSRSDNDRMHNTLYKLGFEKAGQEYKSDDGNRNLQLFIKKTQLSG